MGTEGCRHHGPLSGAYRGYLRTVRLQGSRWQTGFDLFLAGLHENVNDSVTRDEAIDMLAQHLITKPVFYALFAGYAFTELNPVSQSMEQVLTVLKSHALWKEKKSVARIEGRLLDQLHKEIERQAGLEKLKNRLENWVHFSGSQRKLLPIPEILSTTMVASYTFEHFGHHFPKLVLIFTEIHTCRETSNGEICRTRITYVGHDIGISSGTFLVIRRPTAKPLAAQGVSSDRRYYITGLAIGLGIFK